MPKITPAEIEQKRRTVRACIDYCARLKGDKPKQYIQRSGLSPYVSDSRYNKPETLTLMELWSMGIQFGENDLKVLFPKRRID